MTISIIITLCLLLLISYVFDLTSSKTKIPSVILLLLLGFIANQISITFNIAIPNLEPMLPVIGTIGLILIVLEGSLELELNASKSVVIKKSSIMASLPLIILSLIISLIIHLTHKYSFKICLSNAIPFAVISSAIAIPSAKNIDNKNREFITYESSLSDIIGVIFFYFIILNSSINTKSILYFSLDLVLIFIISSTATLVLSYFITKIKHQVKFIPIIILVVLIYAVSKLYHLPGLIFILFFGLFIGNIDQLRRFKLIDKFHPEDFGKEVNKFHELIIEVAFLIRSLFFILFGFLIQPHEILNLDTLLWSLMITTLIFSIRYIFLKILHLPTQILLTIAPRGLITILLFLSIPASQSITFINKSLVIQVILMTSLVMMIGFIRSTNKIEK
ncbi:MAG: hypothetical protein K1X55_12900 [Chitinophagales bacterium]|nr:hypothetical protein [Chitinophagales bacterium]